MHAGRLAHVAAGLDAAELDAFLVTHPPNLRYLTGLHASAGAAVIFPRHTVLVVDSRYVTAAGLVAANLPAAGVHKAEKTLDEAIGEVLRLERSRRIGVEGAHLSVSRFSYISNVLGSDAGSDQYVLVPTERVVERARAVKDAVEVATIREAGRRLSVVARDVRKLVLPGRTERQVAGAIDDALRDAGFERPAFETIVASGPNSALPHARPTSRAIAGGDGVVLDFGGTYDGYCVDLTRTLEVGRVSDAFRRLFDAVAEAHAAALAAVKPGVLAVDIDGAARRVLVERGLGDAFGHGTGHGLGLEVHEEPRISPLAPADERVVAGMVFTIEPGAYVPGVGGVRIEDDVLVIEEGVELLTTVPIQL